MKLSCQCDDDFSCFDIASNDWINNITGLIKGVFGVHEEIMKYYASDYEQKY